MKLSYDNNTNNNDYSDIIMEIHERLNKNK